MRSSLNTLFEQTARRTLPDFLVPGATLLLQAVESGAFRDVERHVRLNRAGFAGLDAVILMLLMFASDIPIPSISRFRVRIDGFAQVIAGVAQRTTIATQSSMSRLLARLSFEEVERARHWLLFQFSGVGELLNRSDVLHVDRLGQSFHAVAYDPVMKGIRQRALPDGEEYPEARRRPDALVAKCHLGRKRGQVGLRTTTVWHGGACVWLHVGVGVGEGIHTQQFLEAVEATAPLRIGDQAPLMIADGEHGIVRYFHICRDNRVRLITRSARYALLEMPEAVARMRDAVWQPVPDSGSGPQRWAADLGRFNLKSSADGVPPITVRVVVSRFVSGKKRGAGTHIDGQILELFIALDVDEAAFTAADVVFLYFSRGGQENAIGRASVEKRLGHVYSYNSAGQLFASIMALSVWNLQVVCGALEPEGECLITHSREVTVPPDLPDFRTSETLGDLQALSPRRAEPAAPKNAPVDPANDPPSLASLLNALDWKTLLARRTGWQWCAATSEILALDGVRFVLSYADPQCRRMKLHFRSKQTETRPSISVDMDVGKPIRAALRRQPGRKAPKLAVLRPRKARAAHVSAPKDVPTPTAHALLPTFRGTASRAFAKAMLRAITLEVTVKNWAAAHVHRDGLALRQHRRLTWTERTRRYALVIEAEVTAVFRADASIIAWHAAVISTFKPSET